MIINLQRPLLPCGAAAFWHGGQGEGPFSSFGLSAALPLYPLNKTLVPFPVWPVTPIPHGCTHHGQFSIDYASLESCNILSPIKSAGLEGTCVLQPCCYFQ
uniref:Uncharacterized protein n=1 Tax=Eutreptiella gymnastica TaxID=73025 RepID=A0A7S1NFT9_9EUGL|mmetsp:Transcript_2912/g.5117  ORF Transcript_2912/g.5117 Transcript_2912/m.5117 type:complete len:101 (+) Transcript_2912:265-567(+)